MLAPLAALATGILLNRLVGFESRPLWVATAALMSIATLCRWLNLRRLAVGAALTSVLSAGLLLDVLRQPGAPYAFEFRPRETVTLQGCVVDPTAWSEDRQQFALEVAQGARVRVSIYPRPGEEAPRLTYGQRVEVDVRLRKPRNFRNPGAFDYETYLARQHILGLGSAAGAHSVRILPGGCGSCWKRWILALRTAALERIDRLYPGDGYACGMLRAVLLGDASRIESIWTDSFRRTGTYHALVISGLHITVLALALHIVLRLCFIPEMASLVLTTLAAWLYALVSGSGAPVIRAAGGYTLFLAARFFHRRGRILNVLAAVALVYLLVDPGGMFDASFQLSFLSVAAIGALAAPVLDRTSKQLALAMRGITDVRRDWRLTAEAAQCRVELRLAAQTIYAWTRIPERWVAKGLATAVRGAVRAWELIFVSATVQFALALPMLSYFHRLSFSGLSANLFIVPAMSAAVPVGFAAIFTGWAGFAWATQWLLRFSQRVAEFHAAFEPRWRTPDPPLPLAISFAGAVLVLAIGVSARAKWRWAALAAALAAFALLVWHPFPPQLYAGELEFTALDVGQGDSLFIVFPDRTTLLVDGGGTPVYGDRKPPRLDIGEDVVSPYLWSRSLRRLHYVAVSHLHADHAGGLPAVIANFQPEELWVSRTARCPEWDRIAAAAQAAGTRIRVWTAGETVQIGGTKIEALWPPRGYSFPETPQNNDSLVLRISYGKHSVLLTGDVEWRAEAEFSPPPTTILKVAHHGSRTSTGARLLDAARPSYAVISAGADNVYGNPHSATLDRLAWANTAIFRTDHDGRVSIWTDGRRLRTECQRDADRARLNWRP